MWARPDGNCCTERLLACSTDDGTFLIRARNQDNQKDESILSVIFRGEVTHHLLLRVSDRLYKVNKNDVPARNLKEVFMSFVC